MKITIEERNGYKGTQDFEIEDRETIQALCGLEKQSCHEDRGNLKFNCELTSTSDFLIYDM